MNKNQTTSITNGIRGSSEGWLKSSFCMSSGDCVEIFIDLDKVLIADSKQHDTDRPVIETSHQSWTKLLDTLATEPTAQIGELALRTISDGSGIITNKTETLEYTKEEWQAFIKGIENKELYPITKPKQAVNQ